MEIPIDYHILFMAMSFVLFIISVFLLFVDSSFEKAVAANVMIMFNFVLNMIVSLGFGAIDLYGFDSTGAVVHNVYSDMYPFIYIYWVFAYINFMLIFYCIYLYYKKPWDDYYGGDDENQVQYYGKRY